jgi:hypothetical protein
MKEDKKMSTTRIIALAAMVVLLAAACGQEPPEEGLIEDLGTLMPAQPEPPEAAMAAPDLVEIVHADEFVTVSKLTLQPGDLIPEHRAYHRLLYASNGGGELQITHGETVVTEVFADREVRYVEPGIGTLENVGAQPFELLAVTRTDVDLPEFMEMEEPQPAELGRVVFETDRATVREITLEPGASADLPRVPIRIVFAIGTADLEYITADGEIERVRSDSFAAYSRSGADRSITNRGGEAVQLMIFEWLV